MTGCSWCDWSRRKEVYEAPNPEAKIMANDDRKKNEKDIPGAAGENYTHERPDNRERHLARELTNKKLIQFGARKNPVDELAKSKLQKSSIILQTKRLADARSNSQFAQPC